MAVLDKFGAIPYHPEKEDKRSALDNDQAAEVTAILTKLDELADGTSLVTTEIEDLRVRALLLLGRANEARKLADDLAVARPLPFNKALLGVALYASRRNEEALKIFQDLLRGTRTDTKMPEVHYYAANCLFQLGREEEAFQEWSAYLAIVEGQPTPKWREPFVARAKVQLGR